MLAGLHAQRIFEILHTEIWQILFIALSMGLWLAWAWWALPRHVEPHVST